MGATLRVIAGIALACCISCDAFALEAPPGYSHSWGYLGGGPGQFNAPSGIGTDRFGNVYVADTFNNRIQKFNADGLYLLQWGSFGPGNGTFNLPWGIDCDFSGNVYVADSNNFLIQKFSPTGQFLVQWGGYGSEPGQFNYAAQLALDDSDYVYVADGDNGRVQKFRSDGTLVGLWGSRGAGPGQFTNASGIAVGRGRVYVADLDAGRIQVFDTGGHLQGQIGVPGQGYGQIFRPSGLELDAAGNLYVTSDSDPRIVKLSPEGVVLTQWGSAGTSGGQFLGGTYDIALHPSRLVYVVDRGFNRVEVFDAGALPAISVTWGAVKARYR